MTTPRIESKIQPGLFFWCEYEPSIGAKHAAYLRANRAKLKKQRSGSKSDRLEAYGWHN